MSKHTPGPWRTFQAGDGRVGVQRGSSGGFLVLDRNAERAKIDANLIAAAPKLLEALKNARAELEEIALSEGGDPYNNLEMNEAINEAEGKA